VKQLSGLDASFLHMETPTTFGHVNGLAIYQRPSPEFDPYPLVYKKFEAMIGRAEPLRRRLVEVPLGLDHPYWIDDPDFDLDFHVRHIGLAPPGAADQLAEQVARIVGRPMDRSRPLWEVYVMEGLADGRWAMLTKFHHATIDGAAGVILLNMLTETDPEQNKDLEPVLWHGEAVPADMELLRRTVQSLVANPVKAARLQLRIVQNLAESAGVTSVSGALSQARSAIKRLASRGETEPENERRVRLPITPAPSTPWNRTITAHRRFAMRSTSLENLKVLKNATGGTLNDVVMAICAGALREYLLEHNALPDKPLRAMVPVSIRTGDEADPWTNRVSGIIADLPTDCDDPLERVARCRTAMVEAKKQFELVPADTLTAGADLASPIVATSAARLASRLRLADRVNFPANVVISNVPGPRQPLYFAGARLDNYIPVSIVTDGMGLNITVHSYLDKLDFGLIACRELVPDLWHLVDLHIAEIERLFEATGADWVEPPEPPSLRVGSRHVASEPGKGTAPRKAAPVRKAAVTKAAPVRKAAVKRAAVKRAAVKKVAAKKTR
jgi:diacylglycerol O-acyltransferase / wax synthase